MSIERSLSGEVRRVLVVVCFLVLPGLASSSESSHPGFKNDGVGETLISREIDEREMDLRGQIRALETLLFSSTARLARVSNPIAVGVLTSELGVLQRSLENAELEVRQTRADSGHESDLHIVDRLRRLSLEIHVIEREVARIAREIGNGSSPGSEITWRADSQSRRAPTGTGAISGLVTDSQSGDPILTLVYVTDSSDAYVTHTATNVDGYYSTDPVLGTGSYYVRTFNYKQFIDEVYNDIRCPGYSCLDRTIGEPVAVVDGQSTDSIDFQLDPGGVVSGTVDDASGPTPMEGVQVEIYDGNGDFIAWGSTDVNGYFETSHGLPSGSYFAVATFDGYVDELYDDIPCLGFCSVTGGTPIAVTEGAEAATSIYFALELGGTISGDVVDAVTGDPVVAGRVEIYDASSSLAYSVYIGAAGDWAALSGMPEGNYFVKTNNLQSYWDELYDDIPCETSCSIASGDPVWVGAGGHTGGVHFALEPGGAIKGTVTDAATGGPLADIGLRVVDSTGAFQGTATTDAFGRYRTYSPLAAGSHHVHTVNYENYFDELYNDIPCPKDACDPTTGTPINVVPGHVSGGNDFELEKGGSISGTISDAVSGSPLEDFQATVYDGGGNIVGGVDTDVSGIYHTNYALDTGDYYVVSGNLYGYINKLWDDRVCFPSCDATTGDPVAVTAGSETQNIDFALFPGGRISGTLTEAATGAPAASTWVEVYTPSNYPLFGGYPDASGFYTVEEGLGAGTYFVKTGNRSGYLDEVWDDVPCASCNVTTAGTPIAVALNATTTGIDFELEDGGIITGVVTDMFTGDPLPDVAVDVHDTSGAYLLGGFTDASGVYTTQTDGGLDTGSYFVRTRNYDGYVDEIFDDLPCVGSCDVTTGTPIAVTLSVTTGSIDFALERGGRISGIVFHEGGGAAISTPVKIYDAAGTWIESVDTDVNGYYETDEPLPGGDYFAHAISRSNGFLGELWDDIPCHPSCDVTLGNPIAVTTGNLILDIDFGLEEGGAISGTVTASDTGAPITSSWVRIYDASGTFLTSDNLNAAGEYSSPMGLPTGFYYARVSSSQGYIGELYDDIPCPDACDVTPGTPIPVTQGANTGGIDFVLDPGGIISGTVTEAGTGLPVEGIAVYIFDAAGGSSVTSARTDALGFYETEPVLVEGDHFAVTFSEGVFLDELYDDLPCRDFGCDPTTGMPVPVTFGGVSPGVDFELVGAGGISGFVTDQQLGLPLAGIRVDIVDEDENLVTYGVSREDGSYRARAGLIAGTYFAVTSNSSGFVDEFYDDFPCFPSCDPTTGTPIAVTLGMTTSGIDFALERPGDITGTITEGVTDAPLQGILAFVYDSAGNGVIVTETNAAGVYTVTSLPPGNYFVRTFNDYHYLNKLWDDLPCPFFCDVTTGTPVTVLPATTTSGIDFELVAGGTIAGTVTEEGTGIPLTQGGVKIYDSTGAFVTSGFFEGDGSYLANTGLPSGTYFALTAVESSHVDELWDDIPCFPWCEAPEGTPIAVTEGLPTTGIDFALEMPGAISGTIIDGTTGAPIEGMRVHIYTAGGGWATEATTDASGAYVTPMILPPGVYRVRSRNVDRYLGELWDDIPCPFSCDLTTGTPVTVLTAATTSGIDFELEAGGAIAGTVTEEGTGDPLASGSVRIYDSTGTRRATGGLEPDGTYLSDYGLPSGTYYAKVDTPTLHINEIWEDIHCLFSCDITTGTPITVTQGATTGGIDFALTPGGDLTGIVTDAGTGTSLESVALAVFDHLGELAVFGSSDENGVLTLGSGLPAGTYYALTFDSFGYIDELFDGIHCLGFPDGCDVTIGAPIAITLGSTTAGIDFALDLGGSVSGIVTDEATGAPIPDTSVRIYDASGQQVSTGYTDVSGAYTSRTGLVTGSYYAAITSNYWGFVNEIYDDIPCLGICDVTEGASIAVVLGAATGGIDFALEMGGDIAGTITDGTSGTPLEGIDVEIHDATGSHVATAFDRGGGLYITSGALLEGTYYAVARDRTTYTYVDELYNDIPCPVGCDATVGTPIAVVPGVTTEGIDFALHTGGWISGTVSDGTSDAPLEDIRIEIYDDGGELAITLDSDASGSYATAAALPGGTYFARTRNTHHYLDELWDNIPCWSECVVTSGTPVLVTPGVTTTGIDFGLVLGGSISGTVTEVTTDAPLADIEIEIYDSASQLTATLLTDASGGYATDGALPVEAYYVRTRNSHRYLNEVWNDIPCWPTCDVTTGTPVVLTPGATTTSIDFDLVLGGSISGLVTNDHTGDPLVGGLVHIHAPGGSQVGSGWVDVDGSYVSSSGLPAGTYYARVWSLTTHVDEIYDDIPCMGSCDPTSGTPIPVALGANTGGIDFALVPGGIISGTVTDFATGDPVELVDIEIYDAGGSYVTTTYTETDGGYSTEWGLLDGTYYVLAHDKASAVYVGELYDDISCPLACDVTDGAPVAVTLGTTTPGIDFLLEPGGHVAGQVTVDGTGDPIEESWVYLYDAAGNELGYGSANATGDWVTENALPAGDVYAQVFNELEYVNELWDDIPCNHTCDDPSIGAPISVVPSTTATGIDFALSPGGRVSGQLVEIGTAVPITFGKVQVFDTSGNYRGMGVPDASGGYTTRPGLFAGTYHVRTAVGGGFVDELFDDIACLDPECDPTTGDPVAVTTGSVTAGIDFELGHTLFSDGFESGDLSAWSSSIP